MRIFYVFGRGETNDAYTGLHTMETSLSASDVVVALTGDYATLYQCDGWVVLARQPASRCPRQAHVVVCTI